MESLPESLKLKQGELRKAQEVAPSAMLCTNTSSFRVSEIGSALDDPTKIVGTHYLSPPSAFDVVELVCSSDTDDFIVDRMEKVLVGLGKLPLRVSDVTGFVINRLQFSLLREAVNLVDSGVISREDLDTLVRDGLGTRWSVAGPFEVIALGGPELFSTLAARIFPTLSNEAGVSDSLGRKEVSSDIETLRRRVAKGLSDRKAIRNSGYVGRAPK